MNENTNEKTSIRDIKISKNRERIESYSNEYSNSNLPPQSTSSYKSKNKRKWPKFLLIISIFIVVFALISIFFHSVSVEVTPKTEEITLNKNNTYQAVVSVGDTPAPNIIKYEIKNFSFSTKKEIKSVGIEEKKEKATGKIKIINNSDKAQKLRKETRFRNGDKIFMTYKSTMIPAHSSIVAKTFATEPGEEYNLPVGTKLDIPGFEEVNSPLFKKMSGEISEEFTGGFLGKDNVPNKDDLELARKTSRDKLEILADSKIVDNLPEGYLLVDSQLFRDFSEKMLSIDDKIILTTVINIQAIVFREDDFLKMILNLKEKDKNLKIKDRTSLRFKILSDNFSVDAGDSFDFSVQGKIKMYYDLDKEAFLTLIRGKSEKEAHQRIKDNFKHFDVDISFSPFWRSSIPDNVEDIEVKINN